MPALVIALLTIPVLLVLSVFAYARLSEKETAYLALDLASVEEQLESERIQLLRDALLDRLGSLQEVAEGSVLYHAAVTSAVEASSRAEIAAATQKVDELWSFYTPVLAATRAREQRLAKMEELAEMWRGRLRGGVSAPPSETAEKRQSLRSVFFGE